MTPTSRFKFWIWAASSAAAVVAGVYLALRLWPLPERVVAPSFSQVVLAADGGLLKSYLSADGKWRFQLHSRDLPEHLRAGLLCLEDRRFDQHPGVDVLAVARAARQNWQSRRIVSGASTLTMQVARLLEPAPRNWLSKAREAVRALQLEAQLSKAQILDLYLAYAPFGANIEGLETAARRFYSKPARSLSLPEAAFLMLLPQSPKRWSARDTTNLTALRNRNLKRFESCGLLSAHERVVGEREPVPLWLERFRFRAPHLADWLRARDPHSPVIHTTVDLALQTSLEALVAENEARIRAQGVLNVGLVAVENSSGEIRAAIGNFDSARMGDAQAYASFLIPRSTGSLLKPFLYGRLLESGEILPESLLEDVPLEIDGQRPQNYNGEFSGLVEAKMALAQSLNVPWIRALRDHGVQAFYSHLLAAGLRPPQKAEDVGVSLAVGGLEASLLDLLRLYRALADEGRILTLSALSGEQSSSSDRIPWLNRGAAHLVREGLRIRGRPDFAIEPRYLQNSQVRWKTGTSQGNRDAWAIGFDPDFTVGVWLGNLDQRPSPALVGPELAAPLMFDALTRLRRQSPHVTRDWYAEGVETTEVCAFSGFVPSPSCPHRKKTESIVGLAPRARCPYHQDILIDRKSGYRITRECADEKMRPEVRAALDLTPELAEWSSGHFPQMQLAPQFHPRCRERPVGKGNLEILSPLESQYVLHKAEALRGRLSVPLKIRAAGGVSKWRCYLNGRPVRISPGEDPVLDVGPGEHAVLCGDEQGRADVVRFSVEL